jgi:putative flippase GtrA
MASRPALPLRPLARFGITGALATGIHVVVAATLIARLGVLPYVANAAAFLTATGFSYASNTLWSFSSRVSRQTLWRYAGVSAFGCLATTAIAAAAEWARWDYRIGILLVIAIVTPLTFTLHSLWTYRSPRLI